MAEMPGRRWRLQPETLATLGVACALLACALVLHAEVIFGGRVYHMDDAADGYYPGHIAVWRAFAHGELPVWERGAWCGWPLIVDPYNGVFYPPNVVYYLLGAARGLGFSIVLHVVLGGLGMWTLLRRRGLPILPALFGGLAYQLSSFGVVRIRHVIFVQMIAWLPWILVGVENWLAHRRRRDLALVAAATGLALLAGALSIGHFAALVIAGYTLARLAGRGGGRALVTDGGALIGAALLGALVAAAQLAPTLAHLPFSPRSLGSDYSFASSYAWPDLRYLATLAVPDLFGPEDRARYFGAPNHWELCGWYVGAACVLLAPVGVALGRRGQGRAERIVLGALVLLAIALALGDAGPVHAWFFRHVPLYAAIRCPARALLIAVLALPLLGAHGLDELLARVAAPRRQPIALAIAALVAVAGAIAWWRLGHPGRATAQLATQLAAVAHFVACASALGALLALAAGGVRREIVAALACLLLAADLVTVGRGYIQPQPADYPEGMERFAAVEWLRGHAEGARFVNDPDGPFRLHNVGMVYGLENASGYDSVGIWRYVNFLYLLEHGRPYPEQKLKHDFAGIGVHHLDSPLLDAMNVRWLLAYRPPGPRWRLAFAPPAPSGAPAAKYEGRWDAMLNVYENTTVLPRAFVAYRATAFGSDEQLAARLASPGFDPHAEVLIEDPRYALDAPARPVEPATVRSAGRTEVTIEADAAAKALLFLGDAHYPGWSATVDGRETPLLRADWAFRAVPLEPGHHVVVMRYVSRPLRVGGALSALGLLGLIALTVRRRRPAARVVD